MPDQWNNLNDFVSSSFGQGVIGAIGLPPLPAMPSGPIAAPFVDPDSVATSIFGTKFDFADRNAIIRALTAAFPVQAPDSGGKPAITFRGNDGPLSMMNLQPGTVVGPQAAVLASAQTLATHAAGLSSLKPLDPCAPECHGFDRLVPLIRDTIMEIAGTLAKPGQLSSDQVQVLLTALSGYDPENWSYFDVHNVGGYLGELRDRYHLDLKNASSDMDERMLTTFTTVVALTGMLAQTWHAHRDSTDAGDFFGVGIYELRRYFFAIVHALNELRRLVPAAHWATTMLPTRHPMIAGELWQWMHTFAAVKVMQLLAHGERSALRLIALTMRSFAESVREGLLDPQFDDVPQTPFLQREAAGVCDDGNTDFSDAYEDLPDDYCGKLPWAFRRKRVRAVVRELLCHIQRVLEIVRNLSEDSVSLSHVVYFNENNQPVTELRGAVKAFSVVCGELPPDGVDCDLVLGEDVEPIHGTFIPGGGGGRKYEFDIADAPAGVWRAEVKIGDWTQLADERLILLPELPGPVLGAPPLPPPDPQQPDPQQPDPQQPDPKQQPDPGQQV